MVTTKPCCWVECKTYSRYAQKWPKSLRELEVSKVSGMKVFIPFPKPTQDSKVQTLVSGLFAGFLFFKILPGIYINLCSPLASRKGSNSQIPWSANFTPPQTSRALVPERKAPKSRAEPITKTVKLVDGNCAGKLFNDCVPMHDWRSRAIRFYIKGRCHRWKRINNYGFVVTPVYENSTGNLVLDNSSQTVYSKFELPEKVETMTLKNKEFFKRPI